MTRERELYKLNPEQSERLHQELQSLIDGYPMHPRFARWITARSARILAEERELHNFEVMTRHW